MGLAIVFPGQGSQRVGMMQGYESLPGVRDTFAEAESVLGEDLWRMVAEGPEEVLADTRVTQPLMLAAGVAVYRAWESLGGARPVLLAGHSLGEYTALVVAGSLAFDEALKLTRQRAIFMQEAVPAGEGAMAAILGLDDGAVGEACAEAAQGEVVEPANYNSPGQVVIAGQRSAVLRGIEAARARGAKRAILLPMSVPSHCSSMRPAARRLEAYLAAVPVQVPTMPVLHNATLNFSTTPDAVRAALVAQLYSPVRWVESIRECAQRGIGRVAECGPGKVLAPLVKRIDPGLRGEAWDNADTLREALTSLQ